MSERFSIRARLSSFGHAFRGVGFLLRSQHNAWIHAAATIAVVGLGLLLEISREGWCWLVLAVSLVWCAEGTNTAIERLADAAVPERHPLIGQAKDTAAGAVLLAAVGSALIGLLVLGPPLLEWIRQAL